MTTELIALLTTVASFFVGFFTAVFAEPFRKWLTRPHLKVTFRPVFGEGTDYVSLSPEPEDPTEQAYYIRASVQNLSRYTAKNCRAYLVMIEYEVALGKYRIIHQDPIPLDWAFLGPVQLDLLPKMRFHFDVFSVSNFEDRMVPRTRPPAAIWSKNLGSIGKYRYRVSVAGENINPVSTSITFYWGGSFNDVKPENFSDHHL
jgi:hypothetical protein